MIDSYYDGSKEIIEHNGSSDYVRISPSSVSNFFEAPRLWWGENLLGEEGFQGNTGTVLGTINHYFAENATLGNEIANPEQDVEDYLATITCECDKDTVRSLWQEMSSILVGNIMNTAKYHSTEQFIFEELLEGIYVGGTYDALVYHSYSNDPSKCSYTIRDYKTSSTKPTGFSYKYKMQMMVYAWVLRQKGYDIRSIELHFVTRPTKTLPPRYFKFTEMINEDDFDKIESQLKTIAHSIKLWKEQPEIRFALAQDWRLREKEKPITFNMKK